jgi:hypothetical protein
MVPLNGMPLTKVVQASDNPVLEFTFGLNKVIIAN